MKTLVFSSQQQFDDVLSALAAYGRKEGNAGQAADALGASEYSGNARRTVREVVAKIADAEGLNNPFAEPEPDITPAETGDVINL